jgi:hypothetical protein
VEDHRKRCAERDKLWEEAEKDLAEIPVPRNVFVFFPSDGVFDCLGFIGRDGTRRLCWTCDDSTTPPDPMNAVEQDWRPLNECSQEARMKAVAYIGALRDEMLTAAEENLAKLDKEIADLREVVVYSQRKRS